MVPLKEVRGARRGAAIAVPLRARSSVLVSTPAVGPTSLASSTGLVRLATTPRASSSASLGARGSVLRFGGVSSGDASGSRLHRNEIALAPETPSTVQWCILVKT